MARASTVLDIAPFPVPQIEDQLLARLGAIQSC